jgi:hypothetical protein
MAVEIREVNTKAELSTFIHLPYKIHKGHKNWLPNMYSDEWAFFDRKKNPAFEGCDTFLALAWNDLKPVGRIMGIISNKYNEKLGIKDGRFFDRIC